MALTPRIEVENVTRARGGTTILREISFRVMPGDILTIVGPSGTGKSTLLRMLNRLDEPTIGRILIDGVPARDIPVTELRRRIGMIFQRAAMLAGTVAQNVAYGPGLRGEGEVDVSGLLSRVGLDPSYADRDPQTLSEGEKQRVSIARTLANDPEAILMDEPTSALDPTATAMIEDLVGALHKESQLAIVFVTHDMSQAKRIGGRTLFLVAGRKAEEADSETFFASPSTEIARRFINGDLR
jgi:putative ABC transport system ATP-binding protein